MLEEVEEATLAVGERGNAEGFVGGQVGESDVLWGDDFVAYFRFTHVPEETVGGGHGVEGLGKGCFGVLCICIVSVCAGLSFSKVQWARIVVYRWDRNSSNLQGHSYAPPSCVVFRHRLNLRFWNAWRGCAEMMRWWS